MVAITARGKLSKRIGEAIEEAEKTGKVGMVFSGNGVAVFLQTGSTFPEISEKLQPYMQIAQLPSPQNWREDQERIYESHKLMALLPRYKDAGMWSIGTGEIRAEIGRRNKAGQLEVIAIIGTNYSVVERRTRRLVRTA